MAFYLNRLRGDPAPNFTQRSFANPKFTFDMAAGRYMVLCFILTSNDEHSQAALNTVTSRRDLFDDDFASFFGVTIDPNDDDASRIADQYPGYRFFLDFDMSISRRYGAVDRDAKELPRRSEIRRIWVVIDPTVRILKVIEFKADQSDCQEIIEFLDSLPPPELYAGVELQAPILMLPNVFEPELCQELISLYDTEGSVETGFMTEKDGKTIGVIDAKHKRRRDHTIEDDQIIKRVQERFMRRVVPEIKKVHQFQVTRMERYIVGCYTEEDGGHFRAHRDNTTKATAHRRFAVSVNLNSEFEGGEVSFPEYGPRSFKPPAGGAVVFSCSLLHAVSKVTSGRRYAFLPFLYDDDAAVIRKENEQYLAGGGFGELDDVAKAKAAEKEKEDSVEEEATT